MKRFVVVAILTVLIFAPGPASARRGAYHRGDAVAWGVLGGILGGVLLDRIIVSSPVVIAPPAVVSPPTYVPYPYYAAGPYYAEPYRSVYVRGGSGYYRSVRPRWGGGHWRRGGCRY